MLVGPHIDSPWAHRSNQTPFVYTNPLGHGFIPNRFYTQMVCYASDMYRNNLNGNNFLELKLGTMEQTINLFFKKKKCILKK